MELFDANGNKVEAFTSEEVEAKINEKVQEKDTEYQQKLEDAQKEAVENFKKESDLFDDQGNPVAPKQEGGDENKEGKEAGTEGQGNDKVTELENTVKSLQESLVASNRERALQSLNIEDAETREQVQKRMENLTGYEMTEQGIAQQAKDAYTLVTGAAPEQGMDMTGMATTEGKNTGANNNAEQTQQDREIQSALGITEEMAKKYGGGGSDNTGNSNNQ